MTSHKRNVSMSSVPEGSAAAQTPATPVEAPEPIPTKEIDVLGRKMPGDVLTMQYWLKQSGNDAVAQLVRFIELAAHQEQLFQKTESISETLQTSYNHTNAQLHQCQETIRQLQTANNPATAAFTPGEEEQEPYASFGYGRSPKVLDPKPFNGNPSQLASFQKHFWNKLIANNDHFANEQQKLAYLLSLMEGDALNQIEDYFVKGVCTMRTLDEIMDELDATFGDPHRGTNAGREIMTIKQRNKPMSKHIPEFRALAKHAKITQSTALCPLFADSLSEEVKTLLMNYDEPEDDIDEYYRLALKLEGKLKKTNTTTKRAFNTNNFQGPRRNFIPNAPVQQPSRPQWTPSAPSVGPGDPMDLSAAHLNASGHLTPEERQRRADLNLCHYCGKPGHMARACPGKTLGGGPNQGLRAAMGKLEMTDDKEKQAEQPASQAGN